MKSSTSFSPCILSWARFALGIKDKMPKNTKKCSFAYWENCIHLLLENPKYKPFEKNKTRAIGLFLHVKNIK